MIDYLLYFSDYYLLSFFLAAPHARIYLLIFFDVSSTSFPLLSYNSYLAESIKTLSTDFIISSRRSLVDSTSSSVTSPLDVYHHNRKEQPAGVRRGIEEGESLDPTRLEERLHLTLTV